MIFRVNPLVNPDIRVKESKRDSEIQKADSISVAILDFGLMEIVIGVDVMVTKLKIVRSRTTHITPSVILNSV